MFRDKGVFECNLHQLEEKMRILMKENAQLVNKNREL
jgi:hypothetical protein